MSTQNYEDNIKGLQRKLFEMNESFKEMENELLNDQDYLNNTHSKKQSYLQEPSPNKSYVSNYPKQNDFDVSKIQNQSRFQKNENAQTYYKNEEEEDDQNQYIEELIKQNDNLKEEIRQKDVQNESLQFRYEKIQSELTLKIKEINQLNLEVEEKNGTIKKLTNQKIHLEEQIDKNDTEFRPHYQKLKSQYDMCLLEMQNLENDNNVQEKRINQLTGQNLDLKNQNRELKAEKHKVEMDRLQALKNIEILKSHLNTAEHDYLDITEKNEALAYENERLKNEILSFQEKMKVFQKYGISGKTQEINNFQNQDSLIQKSQISMDLKKTRFNKNNYTKPVTTVKSSNIMSNIEKLDFHNLNSLGEQLKKLNAQTNQRLKFKVQL